MSVKQILVKSTTAMSLHERFTKIQKSKDVYPEERVMQQMAQNRNRRLAQQMENRPSVAAALRRESVKSRLGIPTSVSVRDRLRIPRAFAARRGRGAMTGKSPLIRNRRSITDTTSIVRRARSPFVSHKTPLRRSRSRSRSAVRTIRTARSGSRSRARSPSVPRFRARSISRDRSRSRSRVPSGNYYGRRMTSWRGRGRGGRTGTIRDLRSYRPKLSMYGGRSRSRGRRGRGFGRGYGPPRGGRVRAGRRNQNTRGRPATKEDLDREMDQYMSTTKASLDKDLDTMMREPQW